MVMKEKARSRIEMLRPLLKDPVPDVRTAAAEAIEKLEAACQSGKVEVVFKSGRKLLNRQRRAGRSLNTADR